MPCAGICRRGANWTIIGPILLWSRILIHGRDMCGCISGGSVVLAGGATNIHDLLRKYAEKSSECQKYDFSRTLTPLCSCSDFPLPLQTLFTSNQPLGMAKIPLSSQLLHALTSGNIFWSAMYYTDALTARNSVMVSRLLGREFRLQMLLPLRNAIIVFMFFIHIMTGVVKPWTSGCGIFEQACSFFFYIFYISIFIADSTDATMHTKIFKRIVKNNTNLWLV